LRLCAGSHTEGMTERILVGFDGSDTSISAVRWAVGEAVRRHAAVDVVSTFSIPVVSDYYGVGLPDAWVNRDLYADACMEQLRRVLSMVHGEHPEVGIDIKAVEGPAADILVHEAAHASVVVVGSSGAGATKSFLLGSVCAAVMHRSPVPVVVVPTKLRDVEVGRVAVGVDGSSYADAALRWATDEADRRGAMLDVVHAWEYLYERPVDGTDRVNTLADVDAALVVERAVALARDRGTGNVEGRVLEGGPVQTLLDASEHADLIVLGSRGRGGFRSMLFGSVAQNVAAHASCPVAVVR